MPSEPAPESLRRKRWNFTCATTGLIRRTPASLLRLITGLRSIGEIDGLEGLGLDREGLKLLGSLFLRQYPIGGMA